MPPLLPAGLFVATLKLIAIGDWGADDQGQIQAAHGMKTVVNPNAALLLGDNFYTTGIHGTDHSARFQKTFEHVYDAHNLQKIPFYAVAGNHDYYGNVSAQIEYSKLSSRWNFPSRWYSKTFKVPETNRTFQMIMIDTVIAAGLADDDLQVIEQMDTMDTICHKGACPHKAQEQWQWLDATLRDSTADYLWVGGHHPIWSGCKHGPTPELVRLLKPRLEAAGAHYMSGHDHCMGHYMEDGKAMNHILAGAGHECCYQPYKQKDIPSNATKFFVAGDKGEAHQKMPVSVISGFVTLTFSQTSSHVSFYAQDGTQLYTTPHIPPRSKQLRAFSSIKPSVD